VNIIIFDVAGIKLFDCSDECLHFGLPSITVGCIFY